MPSNNPAGAVILKIRQVYTRRGEPYCQISIPTQIMRRFGWQPGQYLAAYPTVDNALKYVAQDAIMPADFDRSFVPDFQEVLAPKKDSIHEIEVMRDKELQDMERMLDDVSSRRRDEPGEEAQGARRLKRRDRRRRLGSRRGSHRSRRRR